MIMFRLPSSAMATAAIIAATVPSTVAFTTTNHKTQRSISSTPSTRLYYDTRDDFNNKVNPNYNDANTFTNNFNGYQNNPNQFATDQYKGGYSNGFSHEFSPEFPPPQGYPDYPPMDNVEQRAVECASHFGACDPEELIDLSQELAQNNECFLDDTPQDCDNRIYDREELAEVLLMQSRDLLEEERAHFMAQAEAMAEMEEMAMAEREFMMEMEMQQREMAMAREGQNGGGGRRDGKGGPGGPGGPFGRGSRKEDNVIDVNSH